MLLTYILFTLSITFVAIYLGLSGIEKIDFCKQRCKRRNRLNEIEDRYDALRTSLRELKVTTNFIGFF
jgi:hypothetical protein